MRKLFVLLLIVLFRLSCLAQTDSIIEFHWSALTFANPDTVFAISFEKMKLTELPNELARFEKIKRLNVSKNKLTDLPDFIGEFSDLELLDISKNELQNFPIEICNLGNLKTLIANRNSFDRIPECIGYCTKLETIDLWDTPIAIFPASFTNLTNLKYLDLQGIKYGPTYQKNFQKTIPWVTIKFDPPCDCME